MSATIHYRKISKKDPCLKHVWSPSSFIDSMTTVFGWPAEIGTKDIPVLKGMSAVHGGEHNPYPEIIELVEKFGSIELYASY